MKRTSLALMIALIAVGCEKAPPKATTTTATPDPAMMAKHMGAPGAAHTPAEEKKETDAAKPAEAAAAATSDEKPAEEKPAEEKKE
jgi:hypothetical protein